VELGDWRWSLPPSGKMAPSSHFICLIAEGDTATTGWINVPSNIIFELDPGRESLCGGEMAVGS
jgi:hypothetical protein